MKVIASTSRLVCRNKIKIATKFNSTFTLPDEDEPPQKFKEERDLRIIHGPRSVYVTGLSSTGSLGIASLIQHRDASFVVHKPMRLAFFNMKKIKKVAAGFGFSLFASTTELYGSGLNTFYQIGGRRRTQKIRADNVNPEWLIHPRKLYLPEDSGKIVDISSGRLHSLIATKNSLYALGDNSHGQCGRDVEQWPTVTHEDEKKLTKIALPEDSPIRKVHCCLDTSFVLLENGNLYSFGLGTDGQLGTGNIEYEWRPTLVGGDLQGEKISRISGSVDTLIAVSTKGHVFLWGQNEYRQILNESEPQVFYPRHIPLANVGHTICAGATGSSCIICNEDGEVFTWGSVVLGFGPKVELLERPMQLDPPLFASSVGNEGKVVWVYCGDTMMAAVTESGQLFTWGMNRHGNLALGHSNHQYFPYQVALMQSVKSASFGPDHSLIVCQQ